MFETSASYKRHRFPLAIIAHAVYASGLPALPEATLRGDDVH